jgi:peptidoglycan/LPS O-acetylase OafA/YrhL
MAAAREPDVSFAAYLRSRARRISGLYFDAVVAVGVLVGFALTQDLGYLLLLVVVVFFEGWVWYPFWQRRERENERPGSS